jgi:hypothetical protein
LKKVPTVFTVPIIYYKLSVRCPLLASERDDATQQLLQRPVVVGQPKQPPQDPVKREEVFERRRRLPDVAKVAGGVGHHRQVQRGSAALREVPTRRCYRD